MRTAEQQMIIDLKQWASWGYIEPHELDWCLGAIRVRHGLSKATRQQLKETVQVIINRAAQRGLANQ